MRFAGEASDFIRTEVLLALGTESHAAASVLQRGFQRHLHQKTVLMPPQDAWRRCLRSCFYQPPTEESMYGAFDTVSSLRGASTKAWSDARTSRSDVDSSFAVTDNWR